MPVLNVEKVVGDKVYFTMGTGKTVYTKLVKKSPMIKHQGHEYIFNKEDNTIVLTNLMPTSGLAPLVANSEFSINKRFGFLEKFAHMVIHNITASLLVCGEGGLGKSHTIIQALKDNSLEEDMDYMIIKGYSTPKALYATLYENKDKLIVFDDCDSVLKDPVSLNILKGALDSYKKRTISWLSKGFIDDGLPSSFDFNGQVIFISNLTMGNIDGAVRSRTLSVDLSMTLEDKIERMTSILPDILPDYTMPLKNEVLSFIDEHKYEAVELNIRTLEQVIKVCHTYDGSDDWKEAAKYLLVQS